MSGDSECVKIDVDAGRALAVLSGSVFAGVDESIRELLSNAADSLAQLPPALRRDPEIRLRAETKSGILSVSDNGVGMTRNEAREFLGKLFCSGKASQTGVIGQFGVGFYSCFRLCARLEVLTRSRSQNDQGTRMTYSGGNTMELSTTDVRVPGTTVRLYLLDAHHDLLQRSVLRHLVRRYCNFIRYPIYLGDDADLANEMHAPWERTRVDELIAELNRVLEVPEPLAVFPLALASGKSGDPLVAGVLFVTESPPVPPVRLYVARVLITEDDKTLLPPEFRAFVSAILDIDHMPLVLSRDGLVEESIEVEDVRERLVSQLGQGLARLAHERRQDFARLQHAHGIALKEACFKHAELRSQLSGHLLFRSSQQAQTTLPEYLKRSRDPIVIYADDASAAEALLPLYQRANVEVLYMTDAIDRGLREVWPKHRKRFEFRRVDAAPPSMGRLPSERAEHQVSATVFEQV
ncbi:MAG: ATP-binding protein, partial [Prosthecobacter sp.]|nr:ATP-binding protein [Prosthecobacter sp.]